MQRTRQAPHDNEADEKYDDWLKKFAPLIEGAEATLNEFESIQKQKGEIGARAMALAREQSIEDQIDFFAAYADSLSHPVYDATGRPVKEKYSSRTSMYLLLIVFWRNVVLMGTRRALYNWMCQWLGEAQVGDFKRFEKLCVDFKIRLARVGRPKI